MNSNTSTPLPSALPSTTTTTTVITTKSVYNGANGGGPPSNSNLRLSISDLLGKCVVCTKDSSPRVIRDSNLSKVLELYWKNMSIDVKPGELSSHGLCESCFENLVEFYDTNEVLLLMEKQLKSLGKVLHESTLKGIKKREELKLPLLPAHKKVLAEHKIPKPDPDPVPENRGTVVTSLEEPKRSSTGGGSSVTSSNSTTSSGAGGSGISNTNNKGGQAPSGIPKPTSTTSQRVLPKRGSKTRAQAGKRKVKISDDEDSASTPSSSDSDSDIEV